MGIKPENMVGMPVPEPKWVQNQFNLIGERVYYKQKDFRKLKCFRNIGIKGNKSTHVVVIALFNYNQLSSSGIPPNNTF